MRPQRDPLVERETELAALQEALGSAAAGRGTALLIEGEAGIGKTALLNIAGETALEGQTRLLAARGAPLDEGVAYGVVRQLLLPTMLEGEKRDRLLHGAAGLATPALFGSDDSGPPRGEAAFAVRQGLTWLVAAIAGDGDPLVLLVDDMHWADAPSVRFLHTLCARIEELPVAVLLAARPGASWSDPGLAAELAQGLRVLHPARLSSEGVGKALGRRLRAEPAREFAAAAHAQTAGTPYLVAALADALRRDGIEPTSDRVPAIAGVGSTEVGSHVAARVQSLSTEARAVGRAVAVLGDGRPAAEAQRLAGVEPGEAATRAAAALEAAGLVHGWPEPSFDHPLVRAAVLKDLGAAGRAELHGRAAELAMSGGELERAAVHLGETPGCGSPARVEVLRRVGAHALHRGAPDVAVRHLRRALAEPPVEAVRGHVLIELGMAELTVGDPQAADRLAAGADAVSAPDPRLRAYMLSGWALIYVGRWQEGFDRMGAAVAGGADASAETLAIARIEFASAMLTCIRTGQDAYALLDELDRELASDAPVRALFESAAALADVGRALPREAVLGRIRRANAGTVPDHAGPPTEGITAIALVLADAFPEAEAGLKGVLGLARLRLDLPIVCIASAWLALSYVRRGRLGEAEEAALAVDDAEIPPAISVVLAATVRGSVALERGHVATAAEWADRPFEHDLRVADTNICDYHRVLRGRVRMAQGDVAGAYGLFSEVRARQTRWGGQSPPVTQWRVYEALALSALGRVAEAIELIDEEVLVAQGFGAPRPLAHALRARASIRAEDHAAAEQDLRDAVAVLDGSLADLESAHVNADLGDLLLRQGRESESRDVLRLALDLAWTCGADALTERVRVALGRVGARPRRAPLSGLRALTPAEARTARAAAAGATNREIAEALFVTEKTVETHLTAAYRKLNIGGRPQLSPALGVAADLPLRG